MMTFKRKHAKKDEGRRDHRLGARVTKSEQQEIAEAARDFELSQTDWTLYWARHQKSKHLKKI